MNAPTDDGSTLSDAEKEELRRITRNGALLFHDLDPTVKRLLDELRPEEVEAIRSFARLGPDGVQKVLSAVDFWQSVSTVSKFVKWVCILFTGAVVGVVAFLTAIQQLGSYFGGKAP